MLESLRRIIEAVNAAPNLGEVLDIIVARVRAAMDTEVCSIYLRDGDSEGVYVLRATEGLKPESVGRVRLTADQGLVGLVATRAEPVNLDDAQQHPRYQYFAETGEEAFSSFLGVPVIHQRQILGVLVVQQQEKRRFDGGEEAFLVTMSAQLASAISHAEASGSYFEWESKSEARFMGVAGAPGVALGHCAVVLRPADLRAVPVQKITDVKTELKYFYSCLDQVKHEIRQMNTKLESRLNKEERLLFEAYAGLLDDAAVGDEVATQIREGYSAQWAWSHVILEHVGVFSSMDDPYLRERASDISDLGSRVLAALQKAPIREREYSDNTILVGEDVTASNLADIPMEKLAGIVSLSGSRNSHIAILARSLGVPTVMGAIDLPYTLLDGSELIVDGYRGSVFANPGEQLRAHYEEVLSEDQKLVKSLESIKNLPSVTKDGRKFELWVNTGLVSDARVSVDRGAEGVGLYRTEVPFMMRDRFPSEEEQVEAYRSQLSTFAPRPVTMRTLDIGGDKSLPYFPIVEDNPFLGWRGIRVTLDHPEIFLTQVRAMLKASDGFNNLRIMLPMISSVSELDISKILIERAYNEVVEEGYNVVYPPIGVMIEVPAAIYQIKQLAERVDFLSVGSNDLTQYLLAVDRNNPRVADLYHSLHPAVLSALADIAAAAKKAGKPVSVCGELAGDPGGAMLLLAMGYSTLSMSVTNLLKVKSTLRAISVSDMEGLLREVLVLSESTSVNQRLSLAFREAGLERVMRIDSDISDLH